MNPMDSLLAHMYILEDKMDSYDQTTVFIFFDLHVAKEDILSVDFIHSPHYLTSWLQPFQELINQTEDHKEEVAKKS